MDLVAGRKELLKYALDKVEKYKMPFHMRVAHTFTWNPDAQKLLNLMQKYFPVRNMIDTDMLEEMKKFMGIKSETEPVKSRFIFEER